MHLAYLDTSISASMDSTGLFYVTDTSAYISTDKSINACTCLGACISGMGAFTSV